VNCVVHTHPPDCVVFGSLGKKMQPIGHHGALFCEALPVFSKTSDLIRTPELGRAVAKQIGKYHVLLLRNHGIVVAGTSIEEACIRGVLLEHSAKTQVAAASMGAFSWATNEDALLKRKRIYRPDAMINLWDYYVRMLRKHEAKS